ARLIARLTQCEFMAYSAVLSGIKEIKAMMADAERLRAMGRRTIVFIDEIHRFNKAQQDAFLPYVEHGDITLIGATTENPSFEVISALLSRSKVYALRPLTTEEIVGLLKRALADKERGLGDLEVEAPDELLEQIAGMADPRALEQTVAAQQAVHFLGIPEGDLALAQAAIYLAVAPKSDAAYKALDVARADVATTTAEPVPLHLRNAPTPLMKQFGYGEGYQHAHKFEDALSDMECLPPSLAGRRYYFPTDLVTEQ